MTTRDPVSTVVRCISFRASPMSHTSHISDAVSTLAAADNDVAVISSSGESVPANRSLLSLASPLLRDLLSSVPCCTSPTILLPDFSTLALQHLVSIVTNGFTTTHLGNGVFKDINQVIDTAKLLNVSIDDLSYERSSAVFENQNTSDGHHDSTSFADKQIDIKVELFDDHEIPVIESCISLATEKQFINDTQIIELSEGELMGLSVSPFPKVTNNEELQKSALIQSSQVLFPCQDCGKAFKSKSKLKRHMNTHTGLVEAKIKCKNCRKVFSCKDSLDEHVKNGCEKPHQCPYCPAKFFHIHNVKRHVQIKHENEIVPGSIFERTHQCSYCPEKFFHASQIKRHVQMKHQNESITFSGTEEMSHQCLYCPKKFFNARSVKRHVENKHSMRNDVDTNDSQVLVQEEEKIKNSLRLHKCSYCSKVFLKQKLMKIHKKKCQVDLGEKINDGQKPEDTQNSTEKTVDSTSKLLDAPWSQFPIYYGASDVE